MDQSPTEETEGESLGVQSLSETLENASLEALDEDKSENDKDLEEKPHERYAIEDFTRFV